MVWHRVAADLLRQEEGLDEKVLYWDDGPLDAGELLLWLDAAGEVTRFQLSCQRFSARREHLVEWRRGQGLRVGEVDGEGGTRRLKQTPTIRFGPPDLVALAELRVYLQRNATALDPGHSATLASILGTNPVLPP
jgi:hypothetical protein